MNSAEKAVHTTSVYKGLLNFSIPKTEAAVIFDPGRQEMTKLIDPWCSFFLYISDEGLRIRQVKINVT